MSIQWPEGVEVEDGLLSEVPEFAETLYGMPTEDTLQILEGKKIDTGKGRVVYDISDFADIRCVLKIAYCGNGIREIQHEVELRDQYPSEFSERLAPNLLHGDRYDWCIQPYCEHFKPSQRRDFENELREIARENGVDDVREIYPQNIGVWDGIAVLYDYGDVL